MNLSDIAEKIAKVAHSGETRRDGITPYHFHLEAVASKFKREDLRAVAWLHDILENTDMKISELVKEGIPPKIIKAIVILTKLKSDKYMDYIARVRKNRLARFVKIEDIRHNYPTARFRKKKLYEKALRMLRR